MVAKSKKEKSRARAQLEKKTLRLRLKGGKEVAAEWGSPLGSGSSTGLRPRSRVIKSLVSFRNCP